MLFRSFTLVGATTRIGLLSSPLRDRFGVLCRLEFYSSEDLARIVLRSARIQVALRIAHRIRAIAVKKTVPVGKGSRRWRKTTKRGRTIEGGHDKQGGELRRSISVSSKGDAAIEYIKGLKE